MASRLVHVLLLLVFLCPPFVHAGGENFSCMYFPRQSEKFPLGFQLIAFDDCGKKSATGKISFHQHHLDQMFYQGRASLACVYVRQQDIQAYYVNTAGDTRLTVIVDNGCDNFVMGLARTQTDDGVHFFDETLHVKIKTSFPVASPFHDGYSMVCRGGQVLKMEEHQFHAGAQCSYIDAGGKPLIDFSPRDYLMSRSELKKHLSSGKD